MDIKQKILDRIVSKRFWGLVLAVGAWAVTAFVGGWEFATSGEVMTFLGIVFGAYMAAEGAERVAKAGKDGS